MINNKIKQSIVILLGIGLMLGMMTGCTKKETQENQDHSSVKVIENSDDVEFKDPSQK